MNYEQKYEAILEWAKKLYSDSNDEDFKNGMEHIFPELAESNDAKIRDAIHLYLAWLDGRKDYAPRGEVSIKDMVSWLEQKPQRVGRIENLIDNACEMFKNYWAGDPDIEEGLTIFRKRIKIFFDEYFYMNTLRKNQC